jgi:hypothetical protein
VTVIFFASALPGLRKRLARKASGKKINWSDVCSSKLSDVSVDRCVRPVLFENSLRKWFNIAKADIPIIVSPYGLRRERESAYAAE